jgi:MOSC domain-containing protein YiiM
MALRTTDELTDHLHTLRAAPRLLGSLELIVRRPAVGARELLDVAELDLDKGLVGDNWLERATSHARASGAHLKAQLTVMSARMIGFLADSELEQAQAGDQLYVDLDIGRDNLPAGTRLAIGEAAVIEVTPKPHNGCAKFRARFGDQALEFVNSPVGQDLRLRGLNAQVVVAGTVRRGDQVARLG